MALHGYGLLIGHITGSRPQQGGNPHWLLMVQPGNAGHPPYRIAVNLQSTEQGQPPEIEYQIIDVAHDGTDKLKALAASLAKQGPTPNFLPADADDIPRLDFVRGGLIDPSKFTPVPAGQSPFHTAFEAALAAAGKNRSHALVAVFGTGYPMNHRDGVTAPTGFTGVDNIHMNQGAFNAIGGDDHYLENGANQDGGLIFLFPDGAKAFFVKFHSQTIATDDDGNPTVTGVHQLDHKTPAAVRTALLKPVFKAAAPTPTSFVFADPDPDDANEVYKEDDDGGAFKTPFVMSFGKGTTRGPVPTPRGYPTLALSDVVGNAPAGYSQDAGGASLAFDLVGDTGAPSAKKLPGEQRVTKLMTDEAKTAAPAFLFHLGDVVYFYGEEDYYYSQFYDPFREYPAPIFAIPGNHDGVIYNENMTSLAAFQQAFCAMEPQRWEGSGGILRSTMIQPGVYFTLDAPLVSIIGLYSNCGESLGWLDQQQLLFLYHELVRLKAKRAASGTAVILAIHHCPRWFPGQKAADPVSTAIDRACQQAGFWPDAVVSGHAHLYQKIVRSLGGGRELPYIIAGAGGYAIEPRQELAKDYMQQLAPRGSQVSKLVFREGYVRATVTKPAGGAATLSFEYRYTSPNETGIGDTCTVDLGTGVVT